MGRRASGRGPDSLLPVTDVLLVTCSDFPEGEPGAPVLVRALADHGLGSAWVAWDDPAVDWSAARQVAVRATWDYHHGRREEFLAWAEHVERWSPLLNGAAVFRWNTDKAYLLDLAAAGVPVVETVLLDDPAALGPVAARLPGRTVVKPRVGAGGEGVVVLEAGAAQPDLGVPLALDPAHGPWVVQPLVESVTTAGETSVFVFGGVPVSQVRKVPAEGEIRVHQHRGGVLVEQPLSTEAVLLATATVAAAEERLGAELAYARVDLMVGADGRFVVGELEVTEPGLYLDVVPGNADALAAVAAEIAGRA
jgi:glutathione synthase/RimK-type ligase-like ATP-grasp enzyme